MIPNKMKTVIITVDDEVYYAIRFCDQPNPDEVLLAVTIGGNAVQMKFDVSKLDWRYEDVDLRHRVLS